MTEERVIVLERIVKDLIQILEREEKLVTYNEGNGQYFCILY